MTRDEDKMMQAAIELAIRAVCAYEEICGAFRFEIGSPENEVEVTQAADHLDLYEVAEQLMPEIKLSRLNANRRLDLAMSFVPAGHEHWKEIRELEGDVVGSSAAGINAGFYIGQLFGARMAGASDEQMQKLGQNLLRMIGANPARVRDFRLAAEEQTAVGH